MDNLAQFLSILYAILVTVGYIPGLRSLIKSESVEGVSSFFWYLIVITVGISFNNLIQTDASTFQVVSVGLNLALGIVCLIIASYRKESTMVSILFLIMFSGIVYLLSDYTDVTQVVATSSIILAYVTQIVTFYKTKSAEGTSRFLYLIIGLGLMSLIISMMITHTNPYIIVTEFVNFVLIFICYLQANYYLRG